MYTDAVDKTLIGPLFLNKLIDTAAYSVICLQCFDAVGWAAGRASGL